MQQQSVSGMNCPVCAKFIPIEISQLLSGSITCPYCSLGLTINRTQSQDALNVLQRVDAAISNVKRASVFKG